MLKGIFYFCLVIFLYSIAGCDPEVTPSGPVSDMRSVRYHGIITPVDSAGIFRSFTYTNEFGGKSQSGVNDGAGTFTSTVQLKKGTSVELIATGITPDNIYVGGSAAIYVNDTLLVESIAEGRKNTNTVTVTAKIP